MFIERKILAALGLSLLLMPALSLADASTDLAAKLKAIALGQSSNLLVGQKVYAIGNPFGLDQTLTTGIVSALNREIESFNSRTIRGVIQTDAAINPGNSGGPLLDSAGRLIGVNTAIFSPSGGSVGIGFDIPADTAKMVVAQLKEQAGQWSTRQEDAAVETESLAAQAVEAEERAELLAAHRVPRSANRDSEAVRREARSAGGVDQHEIRPLRGREGFLESSQGLVLGPQRAMRHQQRQQHVLQRGALRQQVMVLKNESDLVVAKIRQLRLIERAEFAEIGRLLGLLKGVQEGRGTLLDNTIVMAGSNLGNASSHNTRDLPLILAGGGFRHGKHVVAGGKGNDNARFANLFVQIAHRMDVGLEKFGSSNGRSVKGFELA